MVRFTPALRRILAGTAALFVLLVALRLNGFSLPYWHEVIDGSPRPEILLGEPRAIRADDWRLQLPLALAQIAHDPPFPVVNQNIGLGQNMLVPLPLPVAHPATLFRPTYWGFFLGPDLGLAWMWWSQILGLFAVWLGVFLVVTSNRLALSVAGSLLLVFSPFFQFWSFAPAPVTMYMGLCFLALMGLAETQRPRAALGWGLLLGWAGGASALTIYPPYAITLAYVFLFLAGGTLAERWPELSLRRHAGARALGLGLALLIAGAAALALLSGAGDAIRTMAGTEYPGARVETGGDAPVWQLLSAHLATGLRVTDWRPIGNICVDSSFLLLFPVTIAGFLRQPRLPGRRPEYLLGALAVLAALILCFRHLGFPRPLALASLWFAVPPKRTPLALGLVDTLLLLRFLTLAIAPLERRFALGLGLVVAALLTAGAALLHGVAPELGVAATAALVLLNGLVAYGVLRRWRPPLLVGGVAAGLAACTLWFNPLVVGGSEYVMGNPLARAIREVDARHGGETTWVTYGRALGPSAASNLFRALGVHALDGTHVIPQLALWRIFDPTEERRHVYNRYGVMVFYFSTEEWRQINLMAPWFMLVPGTPSAPELREAGATHALVPHRVPDKAEAYWAQLEPLARVGHFGLYELPPPGDEEAP